MYGLTQNEAWRQRPEEIAQMVAGIRLEQIVRTRHPSGSGLLRELGWELARRAELLGKHLRNRS
jgi:hypothetical protein